MSKHAIIFDKQQDRTEQSHKKACDVNTIMARYQKTGVLDHQAKHQQHYGEVPALDYREAMAMIADANTMFAELPAKTRQHFDNDPAKFLEFTDNPENHKKLAELELGNSPKNQDDPAKPTEEEKPGKQPEQKASKASSNGEAGSDAKASGEG